MTEQERLEFFESRGIDILSFRDDVKVDRVLRDFWDEAQRQAFFPDLKSIQTAPKDRRILLGARDYDGDFCVQSGFWCHTYDGWRDFRNNICAIGGFFPTHWMPHPSAPPAPKPLSEELSGLIEILVNNGLDTEYAESIDIICRAASQLQKQEQEQL